MPQQTPLFFAMSALSLTLAQPALSLTAAELWAEWQAQSAAMGQTVTATSVTEGPGTLTLTGYSSRFSDPDVATLGEIDRIVMTETGDGRVVITMSDTYAVTFDFAQDGGGQRITAVINVLMPGLSITASGTPEARIYEYAAPRIMVEDGPISGGAGPMPVVDLMLAVEDLVAIYQLDGSDPANMSYTTTSSSGGIIGALDLTPPAPEMGRLKANFALGATTGSGSGNLGDMSALAKNPEVFPAGLAFAAEFAYDSARLEISFDDPQEPFSLLTSNQGGSLGARFSETEIAYRMTATGGSTYFFGPDMPVPIDVSMASAEIAFAVPLAPSPQAQPMSARLAYQDVVLSPQMWGMIDPAQAIPRDPISVIADLAGSMRVMSNLLSADAAAMAGMPGELVDLTVNELRIAAAGAELTGTGSASFAPGPLPMPVGTLDLRLRGANALLDRLQNSGLVPIEQLAMARGLMGAFTRPGTEADTVETTIQFTQGGGITANGVPLQ